MVYRTIAEGVEIYSSKKTQAQKMARCVRRIASTKKFGFLLKHTKAILVEKQRRGDVGGAAYLERRVVVITLQSGLDQDATCGFLIHELTHIDHFVTVPKERGNQIVAEKRAYKNQISFLKSIERDDLVEDIKIIRDKLLRFLKRQKNVNDVENDALRDENLSFSQPDEIMDDYLDKTGEYKKIVDL